MADCITQRELRNNSGEIMRRLDAGDEFIVTRNGVPVGELKPIRRRRFVDPSLPREVLPFDVHCAHAWPRVYAATISADRRPRGMRVVDLMIAATALANDLPLYTAKPSDVSHLSELISVITVSRVAPDPR